jgi:hypothetical protein
VTNLARRGAHSGCDPDCGAGCGACARSRKPLPGGSGHHALRYYGRGGRCCPCTGFASARAIPGARTSREAWPGAECGSQSPHESRGGTPEGERARKQRRCASNIVCGALRHECGQVHTSRLFARRTWLDASFGAPLPSPFRVRAAFVFGPAWWWQTSDAFRAARTLWLVIASEAIQFPRGTV